MDGQYYEFVCNAEHCQEAALQLSILAGCLRAQCCPLWAKGCRGTKDSLFQGPEELAVQSKQGLKEGEREVGSPDGTPARQSSEGSPVALQINWLLMPVCTGLLLMESMQVTGQWLKHWVHILVQASFV